MVYFYIHRNLTFAIKLNFCEYRKGLFWKVHSRKNLVSSGNIFSFSKSKSEFSLPKVNSLYLHLFAAFKTTKLALIFAKISSCDNKEINHSIYEI